MPIVFSDGWDILNLSKLTRDGKNIGLFWKAKARMKVAGPLRINELDAMATREKDKTLTPAERKEIKVQPIAQQRKTIDDALKRDKVTSSMVKQFASFTEPAFGVTAKQLDTVMEAIHNDRLRIADRNMLTQYGKLQIVTALFTAKPRFTANARVAALFARVAAKTEGEVTITQGVHQATDPHFDVLMPGESQQYHVNVNLDAELSIKSVSYMNGPKKADGLTTVLPDAVLQPVVITH